MQVIQVKQLVCTSKQAKFENNKYYAIIPSFAQSAHISFSNLYDYSKILSVFIHDWRK